MNEFGFLHPFEIRQIEQFIFDRARYMEWNKAELPVELNFKVEKVNGVLRVAFRENSTKLSYFHLQEIESDSKPSS